MSELESKDPLAFGGEAKVPTDVAKPGGDGGGFVRVTQHQRNRLQSAFNVRLA